ncbi:MAG: ABC transporter permease [Lachnospiraceae bacterium]|nr:ABC transporter permease [Lachnospiraceae bacterium]
MKNKVQFFSIFIMSFLGLYVFVGMDSEVAGYTAAEDAFYSKYDLADIWVTGKEFTSDDVTKIQNIKGIEKAERRASVKGKAVLEKGEADMYLNFIESNEISRIGVVEGDEYESGEGGVWLDYIFAEKNGIKVGDVVKLKYEGKVFTEILRGKIRHPEYVYYLQDTAAMMPSYGTYGMAFMDASEIPSDEIYFNEVICDATDIDNVNALSDEEKAVKKLLEGRIYDALDTDTLAVLGKDDQMSYQTFRAEMEQHKGMSFMFPLVFMIISVLGIITTMTRMTKKQRVEIGTLKALGFSKGRITLHYISYGFFLSLLGSVLGAAAGYKAIVKLTLDMMSQTYLIPGGGGKLTTSGIFMITASVIVSTLVSFFACRAQLEPPPAETLKPEAPKAMKQTWLEKSKLWLSLNFETQWNLRDIIRNKVRTGMGVVGVAGCTMLMLTAFGCLDSIEFITDWMYGELNTASYQIIMKEGTPYAETYEYARKYKGQMMDIEAADFEVGNLRKSGNVTVIEKGNFMHFEGDHFEHQKLTETGIAMSAKMADSLGIKMGDFVRWHLNGDDKWQKDRIVQIYANPSTQGITMYRDEYERHEYNFRPLTILTNIDARADLEDDDLVTGVQDTKAMMASMDKMKEMMYLMMAIFISGAVILGVVVLYNQGVLSFVEKSREMSTLKVLGFSTAKIRWILQLQNLWVTAVGVAAGIPLGKLLLHGIMSDMPESMDYREVVYMPSYFYAVAGTVILSVTVSFMLSRRVKNINMVEALKGIE